MVPLSICIKLCWVSRSSCRLWPYAPSCRKRPQLNNDKKSPLLQPCPAAWLLSQAARGAGLQRVGWPCPGSCLCRTRLQCCWGEIRSVSQEVIILPRSPWGSVLIYAGRHVTSSPLLGTPFGALTCKGSFCASCFCAVVCFVHSKNVGQEAGGNRTCMYYIHPLEYML